jgi:hypothetical protein
MSKSEGNPNEAIPNLAQASLLSTFEFADGGWHGWLVQPWASETERPRLASKPCHPETSAIGAAGVK